MSKPITYREKIQGMIKEIELLYEAAEWLRDMATEEEKKYWNDHRRIFYSADEPLRKLDNSLSDNRASMII